MTRPFALTAESSGPTDVVRAAAAVVALLAPAAFIAWPLATVVVHGLAEPGAWPLGLALRSLAVSLASTLGALVPAVVVSLALSRMSIPGQSAIERAFSLGVFIPPFIVSLAVLGLPGGLRPRAGLTAIVVGQSLAFLPIAVVLLLRVLRAIPVELEQAAAVLGARRSTIVRRVTLALAAPGAFRTALVVLGLSLADVATPMLLGGTEPVLATAIVGRGDAVAAALVLAALGTAVALAGRVWRDAGMALDAGPAPRRLARLAPPLARWALGALVWSLTLALVTSWVLVPIHSLGHWSTLATRSTALALGNSLLLGLGAALAGTALALVTGWVVQRRRVATAGAVEVLARVPVAVPGIVAGAGYALVLGAGPGPLPGATLLAVVALVACWELPATARVARTQLARVDGSIEEAAVSLGAGGRTTLMRILVPTMAPAAGRIFAQVFAAGVLGVGTVIVLTGPGLGLGAITMLTLAVAGATGAACAVATVLLALAGGALLLGRAVTSR
jgi:iron(III) transport system permease protein